MPHMYLCLVALGCSCSLTADKIVIAAETPACESYTSQTEVSHAVSLVVSHAFYGLNNASPTGARLVDAKVFEAIQPID